MINYTHKENQEMLRTITVQAHEVGLLVGNERLIYEKGGRGTATVIRVVRVEGNGNRHPQMRPQWVPEFGYKDGPSVVGNALVRLSDVFYSIMKLKEEAARAEKQVWSG
jgi:hypothetical protein